MSYIYCECTICENSMVIHRDSMKNFTNEDVYCYLCAADSGKEIIMKKRPALDTDVGETYDERKKNVETY